jgi:hypothetical protein
MTTSTAVSAGSFVNSIGVNIHMWETSSGYGNLSLVQNSLAYLGIVNVRDTLLPLAQLQPAYASLANLGYKFDFAIPPASTNITDFVAHVDQFVAAHPGSVSAIEGPNEVNIWAVTCNGGSGLANAAQYQQALDAAVRADSNLNNISVYNLTLANSDATQYAQLGNLSASADFANIHPYLDSSSAPQMNLNNLLPYAHLDASGLPTVITETGYTTNGGSGYNSADQTVQAKYTLDTLMDAYKDGVSKTFLYELLDEHPDPTNSNAQNHYGLFNSDGTPKLAATALHNLTAILSDPGSSSSFTPGTLDYTVTNLTAAYGNQLLLQKSNGTFDIVLWAEPKIWNPQTQTEVAAPHDLVTVSFAQVEGTVTVYDPLLGDTPIATYTNVQSIQVDVTDHPLVIEVSNGTPPVVAGATGLTVSDAIAIELGTATGTSGLVMDTAAHISALTADQIAGLKPLGVTALVVTDQVVALTSAQQTALGQAGIVLTEPVGVGGAGGTQTWAWNPDGSLHDVLYSGITGQNYTSNDVLYGPNGQPASATWMNGATPVKTEAWNADGSVHDIHYYGFSGQGYTDIDVVYGANKVPVSATYYNGSTVAQTETWNADGSVNDIHIYGVTGQAYTDYDTVYGAGGKPLSQTFSNGMSQSWTYNADGSLHDVLNSGITGQRWTSTDTVYGSNGKALSEVWMNGATIVQSNTFNADGSIHDVHTYGITAQPYTNYDVVYGAGGQIVCQSYSNGMSENWTYNSDGSLHELVYSGITGQAWTASDTLYGSTGKPVSETWTNGATVVQTETWNAAGNPVSENFANGMTGSWTYNSGGSLQELVYNNIVGQNWTATDTVYGPTGNPLSETWQSGATLLKTETWNADGSIHEVHTYGVTGQSYTDYDIVYGAGNKPVSETFSNGMTENWTYNSDGSLHELVYNGIVGQKWTSTDTVYGSNGNAVSVTWMNGATLYQAETWNAAGNPLSETFANGMTESWSYNSDGTLHELAYNGIVGRAWTSTDTVYGSNGKAVSETWTNGATPYQAETWNDAGNAVSETFANGMTESWSYNFDGTLHALDYNGITGQAWTSTDTVYGSTGKAVSEIWTNGATLVQTETWNADGTVHDVHAYGVTGQAYTDDDIVYGANGKPASATYSNGMMANWIYNSDGSLHELVYNGITGQNWTSTDTIYGSNGKAVSETWKNGAAVTETETWNADGTVSEVHNFGITGQAFTESDLIYGIGGKPASETWKNGAAVVETETWNTDGSIHEIHYYAVAGQAYTDVDTVYGASNKPVSEVWKNGATVIEAETWNAGGNPLSNIYSSGLTQNWTYNSDGSLHELVSTGITGQKWTSTDTIYGSNGKAVSEVWKSGATLVQSETWNADGTVHDMHTYGVTGQAYTNYDIVYGAGAKPVREIYSNGMTENWTYNSNGSLHQLSVNGMTGQNWTSTDTLFGSTGKAVSETWKIGVSLVETEIWNPDGSVHDIHNYGVTGQTYSSTDSAYSGGALIAQQFNNTNGTETLRGTTSHLTLTDTTYGVAVAASTGQAFSFAANGNVTLTGGGSYETFVFGPSMKNATITDFVPHTLANTNHDVIEFDAGMFSNFSDLLSHATQVGANTVLTDHQGDTFTLQHVTASNLSISDFIIH